MIKIAPQNLGRVRRTLFGKIRPMYELTRSVITSSLVTHSVAWLTSAPLAQGIRMAKLNSHLKFVKWLGDFTTLLMPRCSCCTMLDLHRIHVRKKLCNSWKHVNHTFFFTVSMKYVACCPKFYHRNRCDKFLRCELQTAAAYSTVSQTNLCTNHLYK